jgi:arylsulfatase
LIAHWPAGITADRRGALEHQPGHLIDIMATCLDLAGAGYPAKNAEAELKPLQGVSLRPAFAAKPLERKDPLFWEHEGNRAVRQGPWKLVAKENQPWELYNIETDRSEQTNLAGYIPEKVQQMAASWDAYAARANVLPLGAWKAVQTKNGPSSPQKFSTEKTFILKAGDALSREQAPMIAGSAFAIEVKCDVAPTTNGVILAHGGSAAGYALYAEKGDLHFVVRSGGKVATAQSKLPVKADPVLIRVGVKADGHFTLKIGDGPEAKSDNPIRINQMPVDGLQVGSDAGGLVGPYEAENAFTGKIEQVRIELHAKE